MSTDEALAELQLDAVKLSALPPADRAEAVRRAYLRRIRQCPPERDPAGFQRARAAFETLQGLARPARSRPPLRSEPTTPPIPTRPPLPPLTPADDELKAWSLRHRHALQELALAMPGPDDSDSALLHHAGELVQRDHSDAGLELAELALRRATTEFRSGTDRLAPALLDLLLLLLRDNALDSARRLAALGELWFETRRAGEFEGLDGERWIYTGELLALPHAFSSVLRRALAEALLSFTPGSIARVFARHRFRADRSVPLLLDHAPLLYDAYWVRANRDADLYNIAQIVIFGLAGLVALIRYLLR